MKKLMMILGILLIGFSASAETQNKCHTSNSEHQKITCHLRDKTSGAKIKVKIRCEEGEYVYQMGKGEYKMVPKVYTAETENPGAQELIEFRFGNGESVFIESRGFFTTFVTHYYKGELWSKGNNEEQASGRCWVF